MKNFLIYIITVFLVMFTLPVFAMLDLQLTEGVDRAIKIAIIPFKNNFIPSTNITKIIVDDLRNSGQFKLIDSNDIKRFHRNLKNVDFDYFKNTGADNVIFGSIMPGFDRYDVEFSIIGGYRTNYKKQLLSSSYAFIRSLKNPVLFHKKYKQIKITNLRALAHRIADLIYKKLTDIRGVFSTRIAYILVKHDRRGQSVKFYLEVADSDGFNSRPIVVSNEPIMSPAWSPDGKKIAYVSFEKSRTAIYVSDIATGRRVIISQFPGINGAPAWSQDGKKLALVLSKTGNPKIYIMTLKTKKLRQITHGLSIDTEPAFSHDGKSLIFTSDRGGAPQIYLVNLSTNAIKRLTFLGNYNARASFFPNDKNILMIHRNRGKYNIAIQNLYSGNVTILSHAKDDQSPSISPNGKMVIYSSRLGYKGVLKIVSIDGKIHLNLSRKLSGGQREPAWSPFLS